MINVTEAAAEKITELLTEENKPESGLRVFVQGGGCSGFQYGLMIDDGEGDPEVDQIFMVNGVRLFVDPISLSYLKNAEGSAMIEMGGASSRIRTPSRPAAAGHRSRPMRFRNKSSLKNTGRPAVADPANAISSFPCSFARRDTSAPTNWST
jgi:iron-sulfur cluster assembly accessory protein